MGFLSTWRDIFEYLWYYGTNDVEQWLCRTRELWRSRDIPLSCKNRVINRIVIRSSLISINFHSLFLYQILLGKLLGGLLPPQAAFTTADENGSQGNKFNKVWTMPFVHIYDHRMILSGRYQDAFLLLHKKEAYSISVVQYSKVHPKVSVHKKPVETTPI